jgi:hypothetical protein
MAKEHRDWHRLFGLMLTDFFSGSPFCVETELDLSKKQQFLDVVVLRKEEGEFQVRLPDGMEELAAHNLITFKSHQEALDDWTLKELTGHYVAYRKQVSRSKDDLLPETCFRLFAVSARDPHNLKQQVPWALVQQGVYDCRRGTDVIRVLVLGELPLAEQNAMLHLFSAREELLRYGTEHYRPRSRETSTLLYELFLAYQEDPEMAKQLEEFVRQSIDELLKKLPPEKRLEGLSPEERLEGLSPEELRATLEAVQRRLQANGPASKPL